jgi:hypothetical protein
MRLWLLKASCVAFKTSQWYVKVLSHWNTEGTKKSLTQIKTLHNIIILRGLSLPFRGCVPVVHLPSWAVPSSLRSVSPCLTFVRPGHPSRLFSRSFATLLAWGFMFSRLAIRLACHLPIQGFRASAPIHNGISSYAVVYVVTDLRLS